MGYLSKFHVSLATSHGHHAMCPSPKVHGHAMCHPTPDTSKNVKFQLSRKWTKFDRVTRFRKTNSTVKLVLSSEI